ncbi:MAG TPA: ribbon-helix-helix protein, CopG family [Kiritimatiellia bacterium]|nr:ribbon-helix-helix protein, CopG family [Kiritimatiellia bacterium]HPS06826.1 ribbon-helix-helix protein, CopG family [Kiritimatiellia bacterium]
MKTTTAQKKRQRAEDSTTVTISLKKELLAQIEAAAKAENRSRSNYIITHMMKAVAKTAVAGHTDCPASGCGKRDAKAS